MPQQGPQQGPMPGQAQQAPMPGMMPKPGAPTPQAMVGPLAQMPMQQLVQLMANPRPDGPPLYAVLTAITKKQEQAQAQASVQRQMAMAQGQQAAQQPPIAQQVMAQAQQSERQNPEQQIRRRISDALAQGKTAEVSALLDQLKELEFAEFTQQNQKQEPGFAYGGEMRGYAGGGAVAFGRGGNVQYFNQGADEFGLMANPEAEAMDALRVERAQKMEALRVEREQKEKQLKALEETYYSLMMQNDPRAAQVKQQLEALSNRPSVSVRPAPAPAMSPEAQSLANRQGPRGTVAAERSSVAQPSATTFDITNPASINALRIAAQDTSLPEAERAALSQRIVMMEGNRPSQSGVVSLAKPQATLTPEEEQYFANKASTLRTRQGVPEDVLAGRQGIASLAAENLAAQRAEREQMAREAKEQRDAALARAQRGILDDPQALLALAGGIDTRRGKGLGSLARGAAGIMGGKETAAEAARKEYALAQRDQRMLQANERQANMLEMQRQQAIRENDFTRVSQIEDQLTALEMQKSQLLRSRQEHAEKMALEGRKVGAMEAEATAKLGRPTEIDFYREDPVGYGKFQAARRGPQTAGDRQDLNELKALQGNLQKQVENYILPKDVRDAAAAQLQQVNAKLAQMAGLDGAPTPTGGVVTPKSQAEFNALPKGARYINPADGKEYIKN